MGQFIDLTGKVFGRLTVVKRAADRHKHVYWQCQCTCGNIVEIEGSSLKSGKSTSCGCFGKEQRLAANTKHNLSHSRIKRIYYDMRSRCYDSNTPKFKNHGGRGIVVCEEWMGEHGLEVFYDWAIKNGYQENLSIDRIDNNGNYSPDNCRWATTEEQNFNRRNNRLFEINGMSKHAKDWCAEYNVNINTFWQRDRKGLTGQDLIAPVKNRRKKINGIR